MGKFAGLYKIQRNLDLGRERNKMDKSIGKR